MRHFVLVLSLLFLLMVMEACRREKTQPIESVLPFLAWGFSIEGFPISQSQLDQLEHDTKLSAQLIQFYLQWPANPDRIEQQMTSSLDVIANHGAVPCITWEPMFVVDQIEQTIPYEQILNGKYDAYLMRIATEIKEWGKPLIIRFAHEMNLNRYHWGTSQNQFGPQSPEIYIKMFRYIVTLFRNQQVTNVLWAFCPNVDSIPDQAWNQVQYYYPGHDYVDLLGMDGYNWDMTPEIAQARGVTWTASWVSFKQLFQNIYQELKRIAPHKPIIVFEVASVDREGNKKNGWIKEALETAKNWNLKGIIWFQANKEEDWRVNQHDDYSYVPMIKVATSPFQDWLSGYLKERQLSNPNH